MPERRIDAAAARHAAREAGALQDAIWTSARSSAMATGEKGRSSQLCNAGAERMPAFPGQAA